MLDLLRGLVERIEMSPAEGGFEITLTGDIARMMALSISAGKNRKEPPSTRRRPVR
jgi:hypothetical protein